MASDPTAESDAIRYLFPQDRFGAYELEADAVEEMIEEVTGEIGEDFSER